MNKFGIIVLVAGLCGALAVPHNRPTRQTRNFNNIDNFDRNYEHIPIIRDVRNGPTDGFYDFEFETGNGIYRQEQGRPEGQFGSVVSEGGWTFTFPDGTPGEVSFVANEGGYQPRSNLLPVGPPIPAHALEQIARSERERAAGIFHDGQYDHQRYGGGQWNPQLYGGGHYDPSRYQ